MEKLRKLLVTACGVIYLLFGIFHNMFWEFISKAKNMNPGFIKITQMLNLGCMVLFLSLGFIFLRYRKDMLNSSIGNALLILSSAFFIIRAGAEFFLPPCAVPLVISLTLISIIYLLPVLMKNTKVETISER